MRLHGGFAPSKQPLLGIQDGTQVLFPLRVHLLSLPPPLLALHHEHVSLMTCRLQGRPCSIRVVVVVRISHGFCEHQAREHLMCARHMDTGLLGRVGMADIAWR